MWLKSSFKVTAVVAISICLIGGTVPAVADILHVPGDYPTIQEAIDVAMDGDEVEVHPGIYNESINLLGKAIRVYSTDGPGVTIINAQQAGTVVSCISGEGPDTILEGFTITGGSAEFGGGMYNQDSNPTVTNCTFSGNTAFFSGGGMYNSSNSSPNMTSCTFSGNCAEFGIGGGGMFNNGSSPTVTNCTFSGNTASNGIGGGMFNLASSPTVTNCILWGDSPDEIINSRSTPIVTYSNVQGGYTGAGNIDADPRFVDETGSDLHLLHFSPCVDAADNDAVPIGITTDLDGNPRFVDDAGVADSGVGVAPIVDMGAYERQTDSVNITIKITTADSVQATIDSAFDGDEIVLNTGTYNEVINLMGKAITLRSTDPNDPAVVAATILDGTGLFTTVITCSSGEGADTIIDGLTISNGDAVNGGGMLNTSSSPTVTNCMFSGNFAGDDGGGMYNISSSPTVTNCTFLANSSAADGGGMYNFFNSSPTVTNCTFSGNFAGNGGGMYNFDSSSPTMTNCTFSGNTAGNGGGLFNFLNSSPTMTNCTFSGNDGILGGGMYNLFSSSPTVTNCTFSGNTANTGAGMFNVGSSPTVTNCILWGDSPDEFFDSDSTPTVIYSNVQGGYTGAGNINTDPFFVDPDGPDNIPGTDDDNLRLLPGSPSIDAADNTAPGLVGITEDLDGNPRFVDDPDTTDTGNGDPPIVDMGAYEFQPVLCPWDLDKSGAVGTGDLLALFAQWGTAGPADFDGSGEVGTADLLILFANWGICK